MMNDPYLNKSLKFIKKCKTDKEICDVINEIYEDGFEDGCCENEN